MIAPAQPAPPSPRRYRWHLESDQSLGDEWKRIVAEVLELIYGASGPQTGAQKHAASFIALQLGYRIGIGHCLVYLELARDGTHHVLWTEEKPS